MSIIKLRSVSKFYKNKNTISSGFNKINLELEMGEFVVITGESGSGKSTLLNVISGLDSYEEGEMYINDEETSHYTEVDYEDYRRKYIGNIFQTFNLINSYTVYQNIELVLLLNGHKKKEVKKKVLDIIDTVGLTKYKNTKASKLSGGQKQRVAIARALLKDTPIIVADEPTGNLDVKSAKEIMKLLYEISKEKLVVIVTHNYEQVEDYATRKISMHDGKIIEDKKLKKFEKVEAETVDYKDLSLFNKILLGFRNTFNIKIKFLLLLLVYLFITVSVFVLYSNMAKTNYENSLTGTNSLFSDSSLNRVIINKKDRSNFTKEELKKISNLDNVKRVEENDLFLDLSVSVYNDDIYIYGKPFNISEIDSVDIGEMPKNNNEIVVAGNKDDYYIGYYAEKLLNKELPLYNEYTGDVIEEIVKIVGIKYIEGIDYNNYLYLNSYLINKMNKGLNLNYSTIILTLNKEIFSSEDNREYFQIKYSDRVKAGEVYIPENFNFYCNYYNCKNYILDIDIKNIYYKDNISLKVTNIYNDKNFKSLTGLNDINNYYGTIFISENDFNKLFMKDTYQVGIILKDIKKDSKTIRELSSAGYNTYSMKEMLYNELEEFNGIFRIIMTVICIVAGTTVFFICYFVIRIILKSRNIYFSTIRILGATKKIARQLLNIELLVDANVAYLIFLGLIMIVKNNLITNSFILELTTFFRFGDYIIVYIILTSMSLLISNRYANKLFKDSVMSTHREEI